MYEECAEAHEKWLKARATPHEGDARLYDRMAHTAWQAHKIGKCSCELRKKLEK